MRPLSRRLLLKRTARVAAGVTVFVAAPACAFNPLPAMPTRSMPEAGARQAWLRLLPDGRVRLFLPRQEMGQGVSIALRQIVAEELDWDIDRVEIELPDTASIAPVKSTVGSDSLKDFAEPVARAAALVREHVKSGAGGAEISDRGQPVSLRSFRRNDARRHVGIGLPTEKIESIVTGAPLFAGDIRLPDLLFGMVLPVGATISGLGDEVRLVTLHDGRSGLLSAYPAALHAAAARIERDGTGQPMPAVDIDAVERGGGPEHSLRGDAVNADASWTLDRRYDIPFAAHTAIEPRSAVAQWHAPDAAVRLEIWTGTQDAFFVRETLARQLSLPTEKVLVHSCRIGGGFGARTIVRQELEAALLAQSAGRPVKVQWSRAMEFSDGFHRPPSSHRIRARLDSNGRIADWWHGFCSGHVIFTSAAMPRWMQLATSLVKDPGVARGAVPVYASTRMRVEFSDIRLPVDTGPWRGLGAGPNGFAIESAMDELAGLAGRDPLQFRLVNLDPQHMRLKACLERVADISGWTTRPRSGSGFGRGIACGIYKESSYAAVVADVSVAADGAVRVMHLYCAQDSGLVVNPDQVRAQIEGNLVWGIGMILSEKLPIEDGRVAAYSFADYTIPTMDAVPVIDIVLIEPAGVLPSGAGETAMVAVAAVANAIAAATGRRVTTLPYRPQTPA
ncbi:MAG: molybdopterin cofactor-binding domain-containing protein [Ferrovibrio sp.]|uniref:xanthine dehydrogenase family protein molybdopterin-binding subunit n=1 Tax=Ferrovibrio sp. TaxID=1917215 RepID=UPI00391938EC